MLISWENEAYLATKELGPDKFDIITPSLSILAEPPVSVVDKVVDKRGTRKVAEEYLKYLYSPEGQDIAGKELPPDHPEVAAKYAKTFAPVKLFLIDDVFGGWTKPRKTHFADGGVFDQISGPVSPVCTCQAGPSPMRQAPPGLVYRGFAQVQHTVLIVPGLNDSGPGHWQESWMEANCRSAPGAWYRLGSRCWRAGPPVRRDR